MWNDRQDAALLAARQQLRIEKAGEPQSPEDIEALDGVSVTYKAIGLRYADMTGAYLPTHDAIRNRLRRLDAKAKAQEGQASEPSHEIAFEDIEVPKDEFVGIRMGFWDLETTDLKAMVGRILVSSIADSWGHIETRTIYDFPQESVIDDKGIVIWTRDALNKYDIIVGWNSKMFDQPMLNARLLRWGEEPWLGQIHQDPMWTARAGSYGLRIGSSKLVNVSKFFDRGSTVEKTDIAWDLWALAQSGDKDAMAYLVEHCEHDVLVLRSVWNHMKPMFRGYHR